MPPKKGTTSKHRTDSLEAQLTGGTPPLLIPPPPWWEPITVEGVDAYLATFEVKVMQRPGDRPATEQDIADFKAKLRADAIARIPVLLAHRARMAEIKAASEAQPKPPRQPAPTDQVEIDVDHGTLLDHDARRREQQLRDAWREQYEGPDPGDRPSHARG
jgi:hypothetical protein